jgi:hypothetical protein
MIAIFYGLAAIAGITSLICLIMVLIKMFQRAGAGLGIVGIITCGIAAYIWGWMKAKELNLTKIMLIWTAAIVVSVIANVAAGGLMAKAVSEDPEFQKAWREAQTPSVSPEPAPAPAPAPSPATN